MQSLTAKQALCRARLQLLIIFCFSVRACMSQDKSGHLSELYLSFTLGSIIGQHMGYSGVGLIQSPHSGTQADGTATILKAIICHDRMKAELWGTPHWKGDVEAILQMIQVISACLPLARTNGTGLLDRRGLQSFPRMWSRELHQCSTGVPWGPRYCGASQTIL